MILHPRKLFLADSLGALLSALLLGVVLVKLEPAFGMPPKILYPLSAIAFIFSIYSCTCFLLIKAAWRPYLSIIAFANLVYSCLTIILVLWFMKQLTALGLAYFISEAILIITLAGVELKSAASLRGNKGRL